VADVLDRVDALRTKRREAIALLDNLTGSIFRDMFGATDEIGARWPLKSVEEICTLVVDCVNRTAPTVDHETPYKMIRTTNIKQGKVNLSEVRYVDKETFLRWNRRAIPTIGDVILTREAPVGESGILKSPDQVFLGQRLMLYRVNSDIVTSEYLLAAFRSRFLQRQFDKHGSGSTVKHLPLPVCRGFEIPTPPLSLQEEFARRMDSVENLRCGYLVQLVELDALFASLKQRAFRGELWNN
jgi:type I restriction enzyme S subunit